MLIGPVAAVKARPASLEVMAERQILDSTSATRTRRR
jgi:hypothetical protein